MTTCSVFLRRHTRTCVGMRLHFLSVIATTHRECAAGVALLTDGGKLMKRRLLGAAVAALLMTVFAWPEDPTTDAPGGAP